MKIPNPAGFRRELSLALGGGSSCQPQSSSLPTPLIGYSTFARLTATCHECVGRPPGEERPMQTSSERRPATTKSHAHVGTPRRSASGVTDRIAGMLASALRAAVSSLSAAHAGAVGHVACDHVVMLLMFARWCECHGTTTPAMRSTGRAITRVSQTLGHADPKTTSVYAHVRPNDSSSRYF